MDEGAGPLALMDLLCALVAGALWYVRPGLGAWVLLLVLLGLVVRHLVEPRPVFEFTGLDIAVALFAASAALGLLIAANLTTAHDKFWVIVGGVALYGSLVRTPAEVLLGRRTLAPVRLLLAVLPSLIAAYHIATADYSRIVGKLPPLDGVFTWFSAWQPALPAHKLHPNVAAGLIAALLPLQLVALRERRERFVLLAVSIVGLLLTVSRGAWAAIFLTGAGWLAVAALRGGKRGITAVAAASGVALVVLAVVLVPASVAPPGGSASPSDPAAAPGLVADAPAGSQVSVGSMVIAGRKSLLANSLALAWDYAFTGLGLTGFRMAYSSYILLTHVGHTFHSHNLFLDVWLEQGLPGLIALTWMLAAAVGAACRAWRWRDDQGRAWSAAAVASLAVLSLHGMVDDAFYGSRGVLLMFIPFAVVAREQSYTVWRSAHLAPTLSQILLGRRGLMLSCSLTALLLIGLLPPVRSQFQANLGALAQTRAELSVYEWPAWPVQDELRRSPGVELGPALVRYEKALALDRSNATANRRLGQVGFSRGEYAKAGERLALAYRNGYANRAARQLYGEWLAINGRPQEAAALWRTIDMGQGQLAARVWWFEHIGEPDHAAALRLAEFMR